MVIFLYGPDSFRMYQRVQVFRDAFQKKFDSTGINMASLSGEEWSLDTFRKTTRSAGLFAEKRFVVLNDIWKLSSDDQQLLMSELDAVDDDTILCVLAQDPPRKDNKLFKKLLTSKTVEHYPLLSPTEIRAFIQKECKKQSATIDSRAIDQLLTSTGSDLWALSHLLNSLTHYTKIITVESLAPFLDQILNDNIFHLTDALGARNLKRAMQLLEDQFALDAAPQYLITMLARHLHTLYMVKSTGGHNMKLHSFVLEKARAQSKHFSENILLELYDELLHIDQQLKTTSVDAKTVLNLFILNACTTKPA